MMDAQEVTITVPLTITVRLGEANRTTTGTVTGVPGAAPAVALDRAAPAVHPICYYAGYQG
jgi:hypothetical protein